ncbi:MAG: ATPase, T2SS/T4P/T4SS family [Planctomycetota bacterium]
MTNVADLLIEKGLSRERLEECRRAAAISGESLDRVIIHKDYLPEEDVLEAYASMLGYEFRPDLDGVRPPATFVNDVPVQFSRNYSLIALDANEDGVVRVATCNPLDPNPLDELSAMLGVEVEPVLVPSQAINTLIARAYRHKADGVDEALADVEENADIAGMAKELEDVEDVLDVSNKAPIIKLVNTIMFQALKMRASDIHFHPFPERTQVRLRIDGILYDMDSIPKKAHDAIVSRVKVMGKMDIAERRLPQDGRATIRLGEGEVDVRISTVPTSGGERIVMRLLDKTARLYTLSEIGLADKSARCSRSSATTRRGSSSSPGRQARARRRRSTRRSRRSTPRMKNVLTIEDPVEYSLPGISQVQVATKKGLTFASGLRSFLRQDPDVMMVGEIRDLETAEVAIRAALTGHLVFSTVHTNDAASTIARMVDQGVEPYLVSSSLVLVVAQRLVRTICSNCRTMSDITPEWAAKLHKLGLKEKDLENQVAVGAGCDECCHTGYSGRTAIYEFLPVDEVLRTRSWRTRRPARCSPAPSNAAWSRSAWTASRRSATD